MPSQKHTYPVLSQCNPHVDTALSSSPKFGFFVNQTNNKFSNAHRSRVCWLISLLCLPVRVSKCLEDIYARHSLKTMQSDSGSTFWLKFLHAELEAIGQESSICLSSCWRMRPKHARGQEIIPRSKLKSHWQDLSLYFGWNSVKDFRKSCPCPAKAYALAKANHQLI